MDLHLRAARPGDTALLLSLIRELAVYERLASSVVATEELLHEELFVKGHGEALLAEVHTDGNVQTVGFALYFHSFSTFMGRSGLYLEDLFVRETWRGKGVGGRLLAELARIALERGCGRLEWSVLDWNTPAIDVYRRLGAVPMEEWTVFRLEGEGIRRLAERH
jgi:GNAT superfamily N-acetyltransferase